MEALSPEEQERLKYLEEKAKWAQSQQPAPEAAASPQQAAERLAILEDKARVSVLNQVEQVGKAVVSNAVEPLSSTWQHYETERLSALDDVRDAYENPGWGKTPLGVALGTLRYVMAPITAAAKGLVGEPTEKAALPVAEAAIRESNKFSNMPEAQDPLKEMADAGVGDFRTSQEKLSEADTLAAKNAARFVGKLGEEAVFFVPIGRTVREVMLMRESEGLRASMQMKEAPALLKTGLKQDVKETGPAVKPKSAAESALESATPPVYRTEGAAAEFMRPQMKEEMTAGIADASREALKGNYDTSKRLFKNIAENIIEGEINPEFLPAVLQKHNLTPAEFAKIYTDTVSTAGRQLWQLSRVSKQLKEVFAESPDALKILDDTYRAYKPTGVDRFIDGYMKVENFRRGMLVGQVATGMRNIWSQTGRLAVGTLDEAMQGALRGTVGYQGETVNDTMRGLNTVVAAVNRLKPEARQRLTSIIDANQDNIALMKAFSAPVMETTMTGGIAHAVNVVNRAQEFFFRRIGFEAKMRQLLGRKGLDFNTIDPKNIPEGVVEEAANYSLEMTFAASPKSKAVQSMISAWSKIPGLTTIQPFPKFNFANAIPFMMEHSPLGYLHAMQPDTLKALASGNPDEFVKAASRATVGSLMLASAVNLRQSEYAGENWYELKIGTDDKGKPRYLDTRAFAPFSTYLFAAEHFVHPERIKPADYMQAAIGLNRVAGTGLVAVDWLRAKTGEELSKQMKNFAGQYVASFLTPARTLTDVYGAADPEENIYRDYRQSPMLLPIIMNMPYLSQLAPESTSPLKTDRPVKAESVGGVPGGLLRQVTGLSVKTKNAVEQEIDKIGLEYSKVAPRTGDPEATRTMSRYMAPMVEAAAPKLLGSKNYQDMTPEMKRFALSALFTDIKKKAFIKLSVDHPYVFMRVKFDRMNDDVQKMVESRMPGLRGMMNGPNY